MYVSQNCNHLKLFSIGCNCILWHTTAGVHMHTYRMDGSFISSHTALKDISRRATTEAPQEPTCTRCSCPRDGRDGQPGSTGELTSVSGWRDKSRLSVVAFHQFFQLIIVL